MKKSRQNLLLLSAVLIAIALIILSQYYPPPEESEAAGTFAKADKYRQNSISDNDIILRSELLKDSNAIKQTIKDLNQFGDFTIYLQSIIKEWWIPVLQKYNSGPYVSDAITELKSFTEFIENNTDMVAKTIVVLSVYYNNPDKPIVQDIEQQVKQFYTFANQFLIRDSIFESTISKIDATIKNDNTRSKEIESLKNLRDRIVIDNLYQGFSVGDTSKIIFSANQLICNPKTAIGYVFEMSNMNKINSITNKVNNLGVINSLIGSNISSNEINAAMNTINSSFVKNSVISSFSGGIGSSNFLQMFNSVIGNSILSNDKNQFNNVLNVETNKIIANQIKMLESNQLPLGMLLNSDRLGLIFNINKLNAAMNKENLGAAMNKENLGAAMNKENLGAAMNKENLGIIIFNGDKLNSAMNTYKLGMFNKTNLGVINNQNIIGSM